MTHKYPIEDADGIRREFTLPNNEQAVSGSLIVNLNGVQYAPANIELLEGGYKFRIINNDIIPDGDDNFFIMYRVSDASRRLADSTEDVVINDDSFETEVIENIGYGDGATQLFTGTFHNLPQEGSIYFSNGDVFSNESGFESGMESGNEIETFWETGEYLSESGFESGIESGEIIGGLISDEGGMGWINYATGEFELNFATTPESGEIIRGRYII